MINKGDLLEVAQNHCKKRGKNCNSINIFMFAYNLIIVNLK